VKIQHFIVALGPLTIAGCLDWTLLTVRGNEAADSDADVDANDDGDVDADADTDSDADIVDTDADSDTESAMDAEDFDAGDAEDSDADADTDPCDGVTCSGHGRCLTDRGTPVCVCDEGFLAEGLECVCDGACAAPCAGGLLDLVSGLCWQNPTGGQGSVEEGRTYCAELDLGGYGPGSWRLPTIGELRSLVRGCPAVETGGACRLTDSCLEESCWSDVCNGCGPRPTGEAYWIEGLEGPSDWTWSTSTVTEHPEYTIGIRFDSGFMFWGDGGNHYRCVRDGP